MRGPQSNSEFESQHERGLCEEKIVERCSIPVSPIKNTEDQDSIPIWKIGRMLIDSLNRGKMRRTKVFGLPIEDLPVDLQGVPKIAQRLCSYLEKFGLEEPDIFSCSKKFANAVDKFKISFDRAGDADLESSSDVKVTASLLKIWLEDLPQPLIPHQITYHLKSSFEKYERKEIYDLNAEIRNVILTCPTLNFNVLYMVVRLLHKYFTNWYPAEHVQQLPEVFAKILIGPSDTRHTRVVSTLIHNFSEIFYGRFEKDIFGINSNLGHKHSQFEKFVLSKTTVCGYSKLPSVIDKLQRSNSEEKLIAKNDDHNEITLNTNLNMRRVNSEENFKEYAANNICYSSMLQDTDVQVALPPLNLNEDVNIHEEIRKVERSSPQFNTSYRRKGRRKRTFRDYLQKPKFHSRCQNLISQLKEYPISIGEANDESTIYDPLFGWNRKNEDSFFNDPSESRPVEHKYQSFELHKFQSRHSTPILNYSKKTFPIRRSKSVCSRNEEESRNCFEIANTVTAHLSNIDQKISQVNRQLQCIKKRMCLYEKDFESVELRSSVQKMSDPDYRKLTDANIIFKSRLKRLREEANDQGCQPNGNIPPSLSFENHILHKQEMRTTLRQMIGSHCMQDINLVQLNNDKLILANHLGKSTTCSECITGPTSKQYKRINKSLVKSFISKNIKDAVASDLPTIDENEPMRFDCTSVSVSSEDKSPSQPICNVSKSDIQTSNIRELSSPELMVAYKATKNEKRKLRRKISVLEQEIENENVHDGKHCIHLLKFRYKGTRAKLKLLEALLMKTINKE